MDSAVAACASKGLDREPQVSPLDAATLEESAKGTCLSRSCSAVAGVLLVFLGFVRGRTRDDSLLLALAENLSAWLPHFRGSSWTILVVLRERCLILGLVTSCC